jgi:selenocysteine lyase/cysteine desulfurase
LEVWWQINTKLQKNHISFNFLVRKSPNIDLYTMQSQKHLFSLEDHLHYLNCATMSPLLKSVEEVGFEGIRRKSQPYNITQETFFETTKPVKEQFASLINCPDPERIALSPSVSYGMATVAKNLKATQWQEILLVHEEFPSDVYAWEEVCADKSLKVRTIHPPQSQENRGKLWNERLLEAISSKTCMVAISPVHWADGTLFDLLQIGQRCREVGAAFIIDGTQSVGAFPFDVEAIKPDALICVGYKWLLGPYSSGVSYFGEYFDNGTPLERNWINRVGSEDFKSLVNYQTAYRPKADRYNVGERSNFILNPMLAESLRQINEWGVDNIQHYCQSLLTDALVELRNAGYWVEDQQYRASHLFGLRVPTGADISKIQAELKKRNVLVSFRGDAIRISPHLYNTSNDVAMLLEGLLA